MVAASFGDDTINVRTVSWNQTPEVQAAPQKTRVALVEAVMGAKILSKQ
jgi:hypothetical protein